MKNFKLLVSALLLFTVLAGIGYALTPPPVLQNIGIYDTSIDQFKTNSTDQSACRACHQTSGTVISGGYNNTIGGVPTRHHNLLPEGVINPYTNASFGCTDCHPILGVGMGVLLDRSCTDCHNATNFWANSIGAHVGNLNRPHHYNTTYDDANIGNPAVPRQCNFCHGSFVSNYNDSHYIPSYNTSFIITPYATWKVTNFSQPLSMVLFDSTNAQDFNKTWGGCESCHLGTVNNTGYNGTGYPTSGTIGTNHNNHHREILGGNVTTNGTVFSLGARTPFVGVSNVCSVCHVITPGSTGPYRFTTTNPFTGETLTNAMEVRNSTIEQADTANGSFEPGTFNVTINGTGCEKCHSVQSIHNIQYNYVQNGPQGFGHINNNTDCQGCHVSWISATGFVPSALVPILGSASPSVIAATDFVPGALVPALDGVSPSVIAAGAATTLTITGGNFVNDPYTSVVTVDGVTFTPTSITDSQIVVDIPALGTGSHLLQLVKGGDTLSKLATLTVVPVVTLTSATLNGATLTITGTGLGSQPSTGAQQYVTLSHAGNLYYSDSIQSWTDRQIVATLSGSVATAGDTVEVVTANAGLAATSIVEVTPTGIINITIDPTTNRTNSTAIGSLGDVTVTVPSNTSALDKNGMPISNISINTSAILPANATIALASGEEIIANANLGPEGATFNPAVQVRFNYSVPLQDSISEDTLHVEFFNTTTNRWDSLPTVVLVKVEHYIIVNVTHFSTYALIGSPSVSVSTGSSSGGGGGGGGGGVASDENFANIEKAESRDKDISKGTISINFSTLNVKDIEFDAKTNEGWVTAKAELLKGRPTLAKSDAPGTVYKYFNIWLGTSGYGESTKIENSYVTFSIPDNWAGNNNIDSVKLMELTNNEWVDLNTEKVSANTYEAQTLGFSSFAIVGTKTTTLKVTSAPTAIPGTPGVITGTPAVSAPPVNFAIVIGLMIVVVYIKRKGIF